MIGIVLVSHSETLARGVLELATQMVQDRVPIALAAGTDNPDMPIGTDPVKVLAAIRSVLSSDGVLVLMDLGSAMMSAEAAIEFLEPEQKEKIYLCEVPLVEGGLAAAVAASGGGSIDFVIQEARHALADKTAQLGPTLRIPTSLPGTKTARELPVEAVDEKVESTLTLILPNRLGLHARPAARLVNALAPFTANVRIRFGGQTVNARSMNKIVTLGTRQGDELTFLATGDDADDALSTIACLAAESFGDVDVEPSPQESEHSLSTPPIHHSSLRGIPTSPGIAIGPIFILDAQKLIYGEHPVRDINAERLRLMQSLAAIKEELLLLQRQTERDIGVSNAAIFEAQRCMLDDPDLIEQTDKLFVQLGLNAEAIWQRAIELTMQMYLTHDDEHVRTRAADLEDAGRRVMRQLGNNNEGQLIIDQPSIVVATDLYPSDVAQLPTEQVLGLLLERGGATSHSAILARALGIPAVVGIGPVLRTVSEGQEVCLDGSSGQLWLSPSQEEVRTLRMRRETQRIERGSLLRRSSEPTYTHDGKRILVAANIGTDADAVAAATFGAEGVGLFRTEYLFLGSNSPPDEAEQMAIYRNVSHAIKGAPIIVRTLDIGGDKSIPYLSHPSEDNPFLGMRGIRFCLGNPKLFKTQLRALLQVGFTEPIKIMLPMVSTVEEIHQTQEIMEEAREELISEDKPYKSSPEIGIMIETPAAVLNAEQLAQEVDFFCIGTNDLTQYIMAADRGNPRVGHLIDPFQPAVLHAIRHVIAAAHNAGIWISMCGEMAGDPMATELLVGMGLNEFSMSAPAIPFVKERIRSLTISTAQATVANILALKTADEVKSYLTAKHKTSDHTTDCDHNSA